jgi:hypothetical protein
MKKRFHSIRRARAVLALLVAAAFAKPVLSDEIPRFISPAVNAYVEAYIQFVNYYTEVCREARNGDTSKLASLEVRSRELQARAAEIPTKLEPEEVESYQVLIWTYNRKMFDALK